jgi:hypothetical protein
MNYDQAREILGPDNEHTGRWHYTRQNDGETWPIGYCGKARGCDGHDTPEEACAHYKQYLLDRLTFKTRVREWPKDKCCFKDCDREATVLADISPYRFYQTCQVHGTREAVATLFEVGESMHS